MGLICNLFGHKWNNCKCSRCGEKRDTGHYYKNYIGEPWEICRYCGTKNPNYEKDCSAYNSWLITIGAVPADFKCAKCGASVQWYKGKDSKCPQCGMTYSVYENGHRTYRVDDGSNPYYRAVKCVICGKGYEMKAGDVLYDSLVSSKCK